jgi:hypothetical protein
MFGRPNKNPALIVRFIVLLTIVMFVFADTCTFGEEQSKEANQENAVYSIRKEPPKAGVTDDVRLREELKALEKQLEQLNYQLDDVRKISNRSAVDFAVLNEKMARLEKQSEKLDMISRETDSSQQQQNTIIIMIATGAIALFLPSFFLLRNVSKGNEKKTKMLKEELFKVRTLLDTSMPEVAENISIFSDFMKLFPRKNPYVVGSAIADKKMFFGRSSTTRKITNGIDHNHYYISGERRSGKTSLLRRVTEEIRNINDPELHFQPIPMDLQNVSEETFFKSLCTCFLKSVKEITDKYQAKELLERIDLDFKSLGEKAKNSDDFIKLFHEVQKAIDSKQEKSVIFVFIIDEFDKINGFNVTLKEKFRYIFMQSATAEHLRLVAAGGKLDIWDRSSPLNFLIELNISKLSTEDARELIITPSKGVVLWDDEILVYILDSSQKKPYEIQKLCFSLVDYALQNAIYKIDKSALDNFLAQKKREKA